MMIELISSASNDAIFELNFVTGKSYVTKCFVRCYTQMAICQLKKSNFVALQLHPDDKQKVKKV
jgi:hypothetical protein